MIDKDKIINNYNEVLMTLMDENYDKAMEQLSALKVNSLINYYVNTDAEVDDNDFLIIEIVIKILQWIYNNTGLTSPVTDEDYDKLYQVYDNYIGGKVEGHGVVGATNASDKNILNHKYPDLRGTLDKVHFVTLEQKGKDNRKSIPEWIKFVENRLGRKLVGKENSIYLFPKWDGLSVIHECNEDGEAEVSLTRGDTELNEAVDLSPLFKGSKFLKNSDLGDGDFGVKTEVVMSWANYEELCEKEGSYNSPRSAVSSILNSKELDRKFLPYLSVIALQNQSYKTKDIKLAPEAFELYPYLTGRLDDLDDMQQCIDNLRNKVVEEYGIAIDGIVIRIIDENIQRLLGRDGAINKYEVAYKFPPEQKKTILKDIEFSVGILGGITPVAKIEPVKMKGNKIKSISLGSIDRFESLNLREGDEVIIKYDVIPYLAKDDTCESGTGKKFIVPTECPYCHNELVKAPELKCVNENCESRMIGKILNYVEKMRISNISISTITTLFKEGYLKSIKDLYQLEKFERQIVMLDGFGKKSFDRIIDGVQARKEVYDYELLGSIGIPDIGVRMFKKIMNIYYIDELVELCIKGKSAKLTEIGGIRDKTANKINSGILLNKELIKFLCSKLTVKRNDTKYTIKVCFTKVRDDEFEKFLETKGVLVLDDYNKEVDMLIIKDSSTTSSKVDKARKANKEIVTIDDAYKMFGYNQ